MAKGGGVSGPFEEGVLNRAFAAAKAGNKNGAPVAGTIDISNYIPKLSPVQSQALVQAGLTPDAARDPKIMSILQEVQHNNDRIKLAGGQPADTTHRHGLLNRVLDVISRPMYAVAEGAKQTFEGAVSGDNLVSELKDFGHGALQGIEGKKKTDFVQYLQEVNDAKHANQRGLHGAAEINFAKQHPGSGGQIGFGEKAAGLGLDIFGDPTTYTGVGLVAKAGDAAKAVETADKYLQTVKAAQKLSPDARDLVTGARFVSGKVSKQKAVTDISRVSDVATKVAKVEGSVKYDQILANFAHKVGSDKELFTLAKSAKATREQEVMKNILDHYNQVTSQQVKRYVGLKVAGSTLKVPGIPNVDLLAAATKGAISHVNPVSRGIKAWEKGFTTVAKSFPELHEAKLQAFDYGMTQIRLHGKAIRKFLNPLGKDGRSEALLAALHGHQSGHLINLPDGSTIDAADWINGRLKPMQVTAMENGLKPADFRPWLHKNLPLADTVVTDGKKVHNPNWITDSMKQWNVKDGGKALWLMESAFQQTMAYKSMLTSIGDTFGAHLATESTAAQKTLFNGLKSKGWVAPRRVPELSDHLFPQETAKQVAQIADFVKNEKNWSGFWRKWAHIQAPIKFMLTLPNPAFHIHNAIGDAFINHLDNVGLRGYSKSAQILKHRSKWFEQYDPTAGVFPLLTREGDPLSVARTALTSPDNKNFIKNNWKLRSEDGKVHPALSEAEIYAGYNKYGLRQNYATDLGFTESSPVGVLKGAIDRITSASEAREDYFRMAHFIHLIDKNPSRARTLDEAMNYAARRVRDTHFDYTDFTKFEKEVMSQLVPFYKWTRKALPLMTQVLITQPGKAALIPKGLRAVSDLTGNIDMTGNDTLPNLESAIVPDWLRNNGYVPVGGILPGGPNFMYVANPFTDMITQQFGGLGGGSGTSLKQLLMSSASPLIKDPYELLDNKSTFTGAKILNKDPGAPPQAEQLLQYLLSQVPITNAVTQKVTKGRNDTLFNLLTGLSLHVDDKARQKGELLRQRDVGRAMLRKLSYQHGGKLPGSL